RNSPRRVKGAWRTFLQQRENRERRLVSRRHVALALIDRHRHFSGSRTCHRDDTEGLRAQRKPERGSLACRRRIETDVVNQNRSTVRRVSLIRGDREQCVDIRQIAALLVERAEVEPDRGLKSCGGIDGGKSLLAE